MKTKLVLLVLVAIVCGCSRREPDLLTGKVVTKAQLGAMLPGSNLADESYAVVNSEWLAWYQEEFQSSLNALGNPMRYEARMDCNRFAQKWAADAQARYLVEAWNSRVQAQALAIGETWGLPAGGKTGHAVNVVLTERGLVWWEPQMTAQHEVQPFVVRWFTRF